MKKICLIFRKPRPEYFSIEKVFAAVKKQLANNFIIDEISVPHSRVTPLRLLQNIFFVSKCQSDIYHVTGDAHYLVLGRPAKQTILTIHDCVFLHEKNKVKRFILKKLLLDLPVRHARIVTTISERSKKDILANTGCAPGKVIVIPNPIDENIYFSTKEFNSERPVILFIGTTPNKNLPRVISAIRGIPCLLDIVGKLAESDKLLLDSNNINYISSFSISTSQLADKYANADMLLFPTTFEGFGLPILEAQKAGRAVITSNLSPMKEVAGEGALLVDPYNVGCIRKAVLEIINNEAYRNQLVDRGLSNAKRFSAEQTASGYRKVYESI